jgi:predicted TIM-barrel fold metal-dependent hydrolase
MPMIVDVDTHWEATSYEGEHPLQPWIDELPSGVDMLAFGVAGDLLRALPSEERPTAHELVPTLVRRAEADGGPVVLHPLHDSSAEERVAWMDHVGIDHCLVNPGAYWQQVQFVPRGDWSLAIERCNAFLGDQLGDSDRLHPVALVDLTDPQRAVAQLEHARARGARAFFLSTDNGRPEGGRSPGHPLLGPVWDAAVRLGMLAVIHVGNTASDFAGWADIGWQLDGSAGIGGLVRLANTQRVHAAQNLIAGMLYGGVFARHPDLTVVLEEMRVNWVPPFFATLERQALPSFALGDWPFDVSGGDMSGATCGRRRCPGSATPTRSTCSPRCPSSSCGRRTIRTSKATPHRSSCTGARSTTSMPSCARGSWAATPKRASPARVIRSPPSRPDDEMTVRRARHELGARRRVRHAGAVNLTPVSCGTTRPPNRRE